MSGGKICPMATGSSIHDEMLAAVPHLRAFAISLTGSIDVADDLVQEALVRGLTKIDHFQPGTNMEAWLFTILRNQFHTRHRKRRREVEDVNGGFANQIAVLPEQSSHVDFDDMLTALAKLPFDQREALILVGAEGLSYEEAAKVCATKVGTIKSRVNRARSRLAELLSMTDDNHDPDYVVCAAVYGESPL
jgi:RNA polymerase sigma-70 factor (ECF subfamily)